MAGQPARRRGPSAYVVLIGFGVLAVAMLAPFGIITLNAFKTPAEYAANGPLSLPDGLYLDGITGFWQRVDYGQKLANSLLISGSVAVLAVGLSVLNAYALGIGRIRGRWWVLVLFLMANTLPQESLAYPLYYLSKQVGLYDTRLSMIIVFTVIQTAFGTYLLASVLSAFPPEILEAARIDGANKWQVLWRVVVPVARPTLAVLLTWNIWYVRRATARAAAATEHTAQDRGAAESR